MKKYRHREFLAHTAPCLAYGIITGTLVGILIFFFKLGAEHLEEISHHIYDAVGNNPLYIALLFLGLTGFAVAMYFLHKFTPEIKGGGIPRSEGIMRGMLSFRFIRTFVGTVIGSLISFFCGLPLGSEGPSVLIGTAMGRMLEPSKNREAWNRYIMTGGACAGFSVATGAPLTAILFALEEVHKRITPMLILMASTTSLIAAYINQLLCSVFNMNPVLFDTDVLVQISLSETGYILLLAIIVSLAVGLFDVCVAVFTKWMKKAGKRIPAFVKLLVVFLLTGIVGLISPKALYGGRGIIFSILNGETILSVLILLFVFRFVMMILTSSSGATGGIFVPTLAIGALVGALGAKLLIVIGMPEELFGTCVLLAMCAFMGGTMRAPLTAAVFFIECTAQYTNIFFVGLAVFTVYFITTLFDRKPFYDMVLEDMFEQQNHGIKRRIVRFEAQISEHAFVIGKPVRDIMWPHGSIITAIIRADRNKRMMDDDGEKKLYVGDTIVFHVQLYNEKEVTEYLYDLVGRENEMKISELQP
jgi:H+/Cl- antiporter ClcA